MVLIFAVVELPGALAVIWTMGSDHIHFRPVTMQMCPVVPSFKKKSSQRSPNGCFDLGLGVGPHLFLLTSIRRVLRDDSQSEEIRESEHTETQNTLVQMSLLYPLRSQIPPPTKILPQNKARTAHRHNCVPGASTAYKGFHSAHLTGVFLFKWNAVSS